MKMKITNIDTISALFDRLIVENIKLYFFDKESDDEKVEHQKLVISEIKGKISDTFVKCFAEHKYEFLGENRTFSDADLMVELDQLVRNNCHIGESDRMRLSESKKVNPDVKVFITQEQRLRKSNEGRSRNKNKIDEILKNILGR